MAISFSSFTNCAPYVLAVLKPVLVRGRHGIGKSETIYQVAKRMNLPVVERRASQMTEGDLLGLPDNRDVIVNGIKATTFNPPDWFVTACTEAVVLFFDEIDRATMEVRQGIFELTDSRKINGHYLHPETVIIGAVNGGEHGSQYQVGEFDPAELDRWTVFDLEPTVEDFLQWSKGKVDDMVWDFINQNHKHLLHEDDYEPNKVYPTPRSWVRFNDCVVEGNLIGDDTPQGNAVLFNLAQAFVGLEGAVAFTDFRKSYERQVTIEHILDEGRLDKVAEWGINEHSAMVEKFEAKDILGSKMEPNQIQNLVDYFAIVPSEVGLKLWTLIGKEGANQENMVAIHQSTTTDGEAVSTLLVRMYEG
tara:strand:- start:3797 stop:4882 length:1086 start_codon:yes stop_codon:yes gene_type:complete